MSCRHFLLTAQSPRFAESAKRQEIESRELTVYYSPQCPCVHQSVELLRKTCLEEGVDCTLIAGDMPEKAKPLPCAFNNRALFDGGRFATVNLPDAAALRRLLTKRRTDHAH